MLQSNGAVFLSEREKTMSVTDLVGLLVLLAVFVFGPLLLMWYGSNRAPASKPSLRECPYCGAQNRTAQTRCYCCGHEFILPESHEATATVIQRVRQADADRAKQPTEAHSPPASKVARRNRVGNTLAPQHVA